MLLSLSSSVVHLFIWLFPVLLFACFVLSIQNKLLLPPQPLPQGDHDLARVSKIRAHAGKSPPGPQHWSKPANLVLSFYVFIYLFILTPRHVKQTSALSSSHICRSPARVPARCESSQTAAAAYESRGGSSENLCHNPRSAASPPPRKPIQSASSPPYFLCLSRSIFAAISSPFPPLPIPLITLPLPFFRH